MFAILLFVCLTVPGCLILSLISKGTNNNENRLHGNWLFLPIVSIGYFLILYLFYNFTGLPYQSFSISYFALLFLLLATLLFKIRGKFSSLFASIGTVSFFEVLPVLVLFTILFLYALWAGAYAEIPSDALWHLARITDAVQAWREDEIKQVSFVFSSSNYYWYKFCGWLIYISGSSLAEQLNTLWLVNFTLFTSVFYAFATVVFQDSELANRQIIWASILAILLLILHYGIGPFSYVRYYTFAPGFFAMTGYWAVLVVVWRYLSGQYGFLSSLILVSVLIFITALLHQQEVMYALIMSAAIIVALFLRHLLANKPTRKSKKINDAPLINRINICFILLVIAYLSLHVFLYFTKVRNYPLHGGWIIPLNELLPFVDHLYVLKPTWQFYQVLTIFGVWAYMVYFFSTRHLKLPTIIVAGLWIPFFTVFNPVFVDMFLRLSYPEVLWRICYMIPCSLFMAYMLVYWASDFLSRTSWISRVKAAILIVITLALLLPFNFGFVSNQYHKFSMLKPVPVNADYRQMQDVLAFLNKQPVQNVLTDQVTGYLVNALTEHEYLGNKFYGSGTLNTNRQEIKLNYFENYNQGLLLLNYRQGITSKIGRISGHWKENVRNYQSYYSKAFIDFINAHPDNFKLVKRFDNVQIYKIDLATAD